MDQELLAGLSIPVLMLMQKDFEAVAKEYKDADQDVSKFETAIKDIAAMLREKGIE